VRYGVFIGALALTAVLAASQASADDASSTAPAKAGAPALVIGGPSTPTDIDPDDTSILESLKRYLSATRFTLGGDPGSAGPGSAANTFAEIGLGGFSFGGRYTHWLENDPVHPGAQSYGLGASYNLDSWTVGVDWTRGNYNEVFLDVGDGSNADVYAFTTSYALRPGVSINGLLEYSDTKSSSTGTAAGGGLSVGIGTLINF